MEASQSKYIQMYGLYSHVEGDEEIVHAISDNISDLQPILDQIDHEMKEMAEWNMKEIEIFFIVKKDLFGFPLLIKGSLEQFDENMGNNKHFFAFNHENKDGTISQVLFHCGNTDLSGDDYEKLYRKFFRNGISSNLIQLNEFYDEGIMNA